jgi:hypothetical protein
MRHALLLLSASLLVSGSAHAQFSPRLGVRLGGSLARFRPTDAPSGTNSSTPELGYQVGLRYQLPLTRRLSLVPEVQYSRERLTLQQQDAGTTVYYTGDAHLRLDYLNVPVLVRVTLGKVYLEAGPQASLRLGGHESGTYTGHVFSDTYTYHLDRGMDNDYRRVDIGPCAGVGLQVVTGLDVSLRVYQGLVSLSRDQLPPYTFGELRRQTYQFSLTYQLSKHA